jgi:hypothetical protein
MASISAKPHIPATDHPAFNDLKQNVSDYLHFPDSSPDTKPFSMAELKVALKQLHDQWAPGDDNIYAEMLHALHHNVLKVILTLTNCIWELGELPSSFTCSIILPILKPGKPPQDPASYCPIALTSILSKLIEQLVVT